MPDANPPYDCIVLGAGISGVTAARDLHREGFRVLVIEGSGRVGGRMFSRRDFVRHPGHAANAERFPLELGAEYVHVGDQDRYPEFFAELEAHGFLRKKYPKIWRNRLAFPGWKRNPKKLLLALLRSTNLIPTIGLLADVDDFDRPDDLPAGAWVAAKNYKGKGVRMARYTMSAHTPGQLYDPQIDAFEPDGIATCRPPGGAVDTISIAGFQSDQLARQLFNELHEFKLERPAGEVAPYDDLPLAIAEELKTPNGAGARGEILLNHRVLRVEKRGRDVTVKVEDENGESREIVGRSAVCTFSVGMLSPETGQGDDIFGDLLTAAKREALLSIRMGAITKFSLEFKKSHWGRKSKMTVMSHPKGCARTFFSAFPGRRGPFVLTGLLMNQDHRIIRELDDVAAVQHLLDVLQSVLDRKADRWRPDEVLVERSPGVPNFSRQDWQRDPFALGGNSYVSYRDHVDTAAVRRLRGTLRDPRETLPLFWSGEATAPAYNPDYQPLAVHGAYISGVGAAADVREFLAGGRVEDAFRGAFDARAERLMAAMAAAPVRSVRTVHLTRDELRWLGRYAGERTAGDLGQAARELCRAGVYLQQHDPQVLSAPPAERDPERAIELRLREEEWRRLAGYAERFTGGDLERALRALLRRVLGAGA